MLLGECRSVSTCCTFDHSLLGKNLLMLLDSWPSFCTFSIVFDDCWFSLRIHICFSLSNVHCRRLLSAMKRAFCWIYIALTMSWVDGPCHVSVELLDFSSRLLVVINVHCRRLLSTRENGILWYIYCTYCVLSGWSVSCFCRVARFLVSIDGRI